MDRRKVMIYKITMKEGDVCYWHFTEHTKKTWQWECFDEDYNFIDSITMTKERVKELIIETQEEFKFKGELISDTDILENNYN